MIGLTIYLFIILIIGAIICFRGKQLYFPIIMIGTFLSTLLISINHFGSNTKGILIGSAFGLFLALLSRFIYKVGIFLCGAITGFLLSSPLIVLLPQSIAKYDWIIALALALFIGICAVKWFDILIVISTAANGASTMALVICFLIFNVSNLKQFVNADGLTSSIYHLNRYLKDDFITHHWLIFLIVTIIIFILGFISQQSYDS